MYLLFLHLYLCSSRILVLMVVCRRFAEYNPHAPQPDSFPAEITVRLNERAVVLPVWMCCLPFIGRHLCTVLTDLWFLYLFCNVQFTHALHHPYYAYALIIGGISDGALCGNSEN